MLEPRSGHHLAPEAFDRDAAAWRPSVLFRLGELYEARDNLQKASERYGDFVELWKNADPELQPRVREAQGRMARLGARTG